MDTKGLMTDLIQKLNIYTKLYDEGKPAISDKEWDALYFELEKLEKETGLVLGNSPTHTIQYSVVNELKKVEHNHKMLSLGKTKDIKEIEKFLDEHSYVAMCKMDGLTCTLMYQDGKLVGAETRGNGLIGEDILHNAMTLSSIPKVIPKEGTTIIDGEIICTYDNFKPFSELYKNPRNFAAGSIRLLDAKECSKRNLTFVAWEAIQGFTSNRFDHRLKELRQLGFTVVPYLLLGGTDAHMPDVPIFNLKSMAQLQGYPIDGIVYKFNDIQYGESLGETAHHFKNAMAYKFYDEIYSTELINIEWSMGRTGVLTPIAIFKPVEMDGSVVSRASLHNVSILQEVLGRPYPGQKLEIYKANMIIPQILSAEKKEYKGNNYIDWPTACPVCGFPIEIRSSNDSQFLICSNSDCDGKLANHLDHFCSKKGLDIKGISKTTLEKLMDWGWIDSISDLFTLKEHRNEWVQKTGFGEKSVDKILSTIEEAKNCELSHFIAAIGIPLIGTTASKALVKTFPTWEDFITAVENKYDFYMLPNFGEEMHKAILNFNYEEAKEIVKNLNFKELPTINSTEQKLKDLTFVITGSLTHFKNRDAIKTAIAAAGGKTTDVVSKNTKYLINNDKESTSSKNKKAKDLGIPIITEEEFIETFGIE